MKSLIIIAGIFASMTLVAKESIKINQQYFENLNWDELPVIKKIKLDKVSADFAIITI